MWKWFKKLFKSDGTLRYLDEKNDKLDIEYQKNGLPAKFINQMIDEIKRKQGKDGKEIVSMEKKDYKVEGDLTITNIVVKYNNGTEDNYEVIAKNGEGSQIDAYTKKESDEKFETIEIHTADFSAIEGTMNYQFNQIDEELVRLNDVKGEVKTVNNKKPDEKGNVEIEGTTIDLTNLQQPINIKNGDKNRIVVNGMDVDLYDVNGNRVATCRENIELINQSNNAAQVIYNSKNGVLTLEKDDFSNAGNREIVNKEYVDTHTGVGVIKSKEVAFNQIAPNKFAYLFTDTQNWKTYSLFAKQNYDELRYTFMFTLNSTNYSVNVMSEFGDILAHWTVSKAQNGNLQIEVELDSSFTERVIPVYVSYLE